MCKLPNEYIEPISKILAWCKSAYRYDEVDSTLMDRIACRIGKGEYEESDLYLLDQSISYAKKDSAECGVDEDTVQIIFNWCRPLYEQSLKK